MSDHYYYDENDVNKKRIKEYFRVCLICYLISDFTIKLLSQYVRYDSRAEFILKSLFILVNVIIFN